METIQVYVQGAFAGCPKRRNRWNSRRSLSQISRQGWRIWSNAATPRRSVRIALSQIGDLDELVREFDTTDSSIAEAPQVVAVQTSRLNLHVAVLATGIAAVTLLLLLVVGSPRMRFESVTCCLASLLL